MKTPPSEKPTEPKSTAVQIVELLVLAIVSLAGFGLIAWVFFAIINDPTI